MEKSSKDSKNHSEKKRKRKRITSDDNDEKKVSSSVADELVRDSPMKSEPAEVVVAVSDRPKKFVPEGARPLHSFPEGSVVCNVELRVGRGAQLARAPGASVIVVSHNPEKGTTILKLPSGAQKTVKSGCCAVLGKVAGAGRPEKPKVKKENASDNDKVKRQCLPKQVHAGAGRTEKPTVEKETACDDDKFKRKRLPKKVHAGADKSEKPTVKKESACDDDKGKRKRLPKKVRAASTNPVHGGGKH